LGGGGGIKKKEGGGGKKQVKEREREIEKKLYITI